MEKRRKSHLLSIIIIFCIAIAGAILILKGINSKGSTEIPENVTTSEHESTTYPETGILTDILLPVTDFNDATQDIAASEISNYQLVSVNNLTPAQKVLSVDGNYFFDTFNSGAVFKSITFESDDTAAAKKAAENYEAPKLPTKDTVLSLTQTGTTALARRIMMKLNQGVSGSYFAENIKDFLSSFDLTHISNEVSFADDCTVQDMTLCANPKLYDTLTAIGVDIVELTGNHNNDWGASANIATIEKYQASGIKTFGGGINEEEAAKPLEISEKGTKITMIGVNNSTSTKENGQGASGNHPGANIYDEATTKAQIKEAKDRGDFVIVDVQFAECYCYPDYGEEIPECDQPISGQKEFFHHLADLGADLIIGTQAHQTQVYEIYNGTPIYYGLGNLFFDQILWPGTTRSLVLTHYFYEGKLLNTRIHTTIYGSNFQTRLMTSAEESAFLERLNKN